MTPAGEFPWDDSRLVVAPATRRLRLGDRTALFCARRQQLYELNAAADAIWLALAAEGSPKAAAASLCGGQSDISEVLALVRQAAVGWMYNGQLAPAEIHALVDGAPTGGLTVELDELHLDLRTFGDIDPAPVAAVFGQFDSGRAGARSISIVGAGGLIFMFEGRQPLGAWNLETWIPQLKARITEQYTHAVRGAFLTHGALLSRDGRGLLLCGEPGAGKTTLTVALGAAGLNYHSDDIVRIDEAGLAMGAPFSPALKTGSWMLLNDRIADLQSLPIYLRSDGQQVRYLPIAAAPREPMPLAAVVLLARQNDATARIDPIEPLEALTTVLGSAFSARGAIEADPLEALARSIGQARCGRLSYSNLDEAVGAVTGLLP